jgi:hypothetical protein
MSIYNEVERRNITNVLGIIEGSAEPGQYHIISLDITYALILVVYNWVESVLSLGATRNVNTFLVACVTSYNQCCQMLFKLCVRERAATRQTETLCHRQSRKSGLMTSWKKQRKSDCDVNLKKITVGHITQQSALGTGRHQQLCLYGLHQGCDSSGLITCNGTIRLVRLDPSVLEISGKWDQEFL